MNQPKNGPEAGIGPEKWKKEARNQVFAKGDLTSKLNFFRKIDNRAGGQVNAKR